MYPQQPQYPPQQYAQPAYPQYPVQPAYPPQYPAQPLHAPAQPLPTGTLSDFYDQPSSGGGPAFKFMDVNRAPMIGKTYSGIVARALNNGDIRAQTDQAGQPVRYKDGRPKFVMVVPMLVPQSPEFPDGTAGWWVKGQARDELARAMAEAGAPEGPPEAGAAITVTLTGTRPIPGFNPQFLYRVQYLRPQGAPVQAAPPVSAPVAPQQYGPDPGGQIVNPVAPQYQAPAPVAPQQGELPALTAEQQALLARLTGNATG